MSKSDSSGCGTVVAIVVLMILISVLAKGCQVVNDLIGVDEKQEEVKSTVVVDGQNGYLIQNTFIAIDQESFDELISYYVADNGDAIIRMMENGRIFAGSKGEMVTVIDSGFTQSYIEIVSTGMRGYVESELVRSRIEE